MPVRARRTGGGTACGSVFAGGARRGGKGDGHLRRGVAPAPLLRRSEPVYQVRSRGRTEYVLIDPVWLENRSGQMAAAKQLKAAMLARRASKGRRGKRTRPEPRQYTVADLERARDRVAAAERRIDNDHTSNPDRGRAGLERAQLELHIIESQLRLRGLLE